MILANENIPEVTPAELDATVRHLRLVIDNDHPRPVEAYAANPRPLVTELPRRRWLGWLNRGVIFAALAAYAFGAALPFAIDLVARARGY